MRNLTTRARLVLAVIPAVVAATFALSLASTDPKTAEELMRESGLWQDLGEVADEVRSGLHGFIEQSPKKPERSEIARLEHLIDTAFSSERLRSVARDVVEKQTNEQHVAALREWFASPDGKAVTKAEIAAPGTREGIEKLKKEGIVLLEKMPKTRRDLLDAILAASRSAEVTTNITIRSSLAVLAALHRSNPDLPLPAKASCATDSKPHAHEWKKASIPRSSRCTQAPIGKLPTRSSSAMRSC
ncbi:MAG TPA: hypothetical protein VN634_02630 [Candidatus Limnocylindrales bacterium]|nr:hypothetical protein [Candidatus Limnocylindrales bacterium]